MDRDPLEAQGLRIGKEKVVEADDFDPVAFVREYFSARNLDSFLDVIGKKFDKRKRIKVAKVMAENEYSVFVCAEYFKKFKINDEKERIKIAETIAETESWVCAKYFRNFEINDEKERIKIAETIAETESWVCAKYFRNFEINNKIYKVKIARIVAENNPDVFIIYRQNFEIENEEKGKDDKQVFDLEMNRIMKSVAKHLFGVEEGGRVIQELREFFFGGEISSQLEKLLLYAIENNNRPDNFSESGLPLISYFFQQGGGEFFENLKMELRKMPEDRKTFLEQYKYLREQTEPEILKEGNKHDNSVEVDGRSGREEKKILVFYFRYETPAWHKMWQGSDLLQSSMMIEDLITLIQQNKLSNFDKLVVVPRGDNDLPFFVQNELEKRFGKKWVDEHLEMTNEYHKYDKDSNTCWIELVDGIPHTKNSGILGVIFEATKRDRKYGREDHLVCRNIFWPDPDGTSCFINNAKSDTGFGKNQAPTLKTVRESLLNKVIELDKIVGKERK